MTSEAQKRCVHYRVRGRVQGVFYRGSTEARARQLGLTGWVRNDENGDVEMIACGDAAALKALEEWLWRGPAHAQVKDVVATPSAWEYFEGFEVRR